MRTKKNPKVTRKNWINKKVKRKAKVKVKIKNQLSRLFLLYQLILKINKKYNQIIPNLLTSIPNNHWVKARIKDQQ